MLKKYYLIFPLVLLVACTGQVKGPISGSRYNLEVGCTEDMRRYKEEREQVVTDTGKKVKAKDINLDCPPDELPTEELKVQ